LCHAIELEIKTITKLLQNLTSKEDQIVDLIGRSFLSEKLKTQLFTKISEEIEEIKK